MTSDLEIFFSNRLCVLYELLKRELFIPEASPMTRRMIVVYGPAMKSWLMLKMAQDPDLLVAAGIEVIYLNQAFDHLLNLTSITHSAHTPTFLELSLAIEKEFKEVIQNYHFFQHDEQLDWLPLLKYFHLDPLTIGPHVQLSRKSEKRLIELSRQIARLFQDYGRFALNMTLSFEESTCSGWQPRLWQKLFKEELNWTYPAKALRQAESFTVKKRAELQNFTLHFFSISFLTGSEFKYLSWLSQSILVHYYLLSPCAVFWSDIRSDRESAYLQQYWQKKLGDKSQQLKNLEEFLRDRNPLLANFGKMGREMACQIDESQAQVNAAYVLSHHVTQLDDDLFVHGDLFLEDSSSHLTLLQAVQADLLMMRNPQNTSSFLEEIDSIQLHAASNKRREVEILYHNLLGLIKKDPALPPSDILVMAPQIGDYTPFIQSIFGNEKSLLDFQLLDLGMQNLSEIVQGFLQLLDLSESRWDASHLLHLFSHPSFQRRHRIAPTDFSTIERWIEKGGIRWGEDSLHRNSLLRRSHCKREMVEKTLVGTWDFGMTCLIRGLTIATGEEAVQQLEGHACSGAEFSQSDLLSRWIRLIHALRDDLTPLEDRTEMSMERWGSFLNCLLENYFLPDFEDAHSVQEFEELKNQLDLLSHSARFLKKTSYSYASVKIHLKDLLDNHGMTYREDRLNTVRFCSLIPLRSIPANAIAILGMQEEAFPRQELQTSLNLMIERKDSSYCPTSQDKDRYLFLEAVHSAQKYLLLSYQGFESKEGKELKASLLIEEFFSYLDKYYIVRGKKPSEICFYKHPFESFDPLYFSKESRFANFSMHDFKTSISIFDSTQSLPYRFIENFRFEKPHVSEVFEKGSCLDLRTLSNAARDPIKFHLNHSLEIFLETEEERKIKTEEEISISSLDKHKIMQLALKKPIDAVLQRAEKEGKLPFGLFKDVAKKKIKKEAFEISTLVKNFAIDLSQVYQIEFCLGCTQPEKLSDDRWLFPAVTLPFENGYCLQVTGKLLNATPKGLLVLEKGSLEDAWKNWPQFLLYCHVAKNRYFNWEPNILFAKSGKSKTAFFDNPENLLKQFVNYYAICLKNFSPLSPQWIGLILKEDVEALKESMTKVFNESFTGYQNKHLSFVLNKHLLPDPDLIVQEWQSLAKELIGDLIRHWEY